MAKGDIDIQAPQRSLPPYTRLTIRQLRWLHELGEHGQPSEIVRHFDGVTNAMLSRDLADLGEFLGIREFYTVESNEVRLTPEAERLLVGIEPALAILERFDQQRKDPQRQVRVGSGGSIIAWLLGPRAGTLREACALNSDEQVRLVSSPMRNRDVLSNVLNGALDFGFIRSSLLENVRESTRRKLGEVEIGEVIYGVAVPNKILSKHEKDYLFLLRGSPSEANKAQIELLESEFVTTVGPEGEFWVRFSDAIEGNDVRLNVEFSYRSFPQTLPHLLAGTHVAVVPCPPNWELSIPECQVFPLHILSNYKRRITMIWNAEIAKKSQWFDPQKIASIVRF